MDFTQNHRYFRIDRRDLVYLKFVLEAHEGLTTLSTVDKGQVIVRISYPSVLADQAAELLRAMSQEIMMHEVPEGADNDA